MPARSPRRSARPASASRARATASGSWRVGDRARRVARGVVARRDQARREVVEEGRRCHRLAHQGRRAVASLGRLRGVRPRRGCRPGRAPPPAPDGAPPATAPRTRPATARRRRPARRASPRCGRRRGRRSRPPRAPRPRGRRRARGTRGSRPPGRRPAAGRPAPRGRRPAGRGATAPAGSARAPARTLAARRRRRTRRGAGRYRVPVSTRAAPAPGQERRRQAGLGGLVPTGAVARAGDTLVLALVVEVHPEGAVLPLLVLSDAPGLLGWDPVQGLARPRRRGARVRGAARWRSRPGLGALQTAAWIEPAPPPEARALRLEVTGLMRTAVARGGGGVERPLAGESWELEVDLVPGRTAVDPPPEPAGAPPRAARPGCRRAPSAASATSSRSARRGWPRAPRSASGRWSATRTARSSASARSPTSPCGWGPSPPASGDRRGLGRPRAPLRASRRSTARRAPAGARRASRSSPPSIPRPARWPRAWRPCPARARRPAAARPWPGPFTFGIAVPPPS